MLLATSSAQSDAEMEQRAKAFMVALQDVLKINSFVDANVRFCFDYAEETVPLVQQAANEWRIANDIDNLTTIILSVNKNLNNSVDKLQRELYVENLELLEARAVAQAAGWCKQLPELLQSENMSLKRNFSHELQLIADFHDVVITKQRSEFRTISLARQILPSIANLTFQSVRAAGINPNYGLIPTEFRCYAERPGSDYNVPDFVVQIQADGNYQSSYGRGRYDSVLDDDETESRELTWTGVLGEFGSSRISFNQYGQKFTINRLKLDTRSYDYECYQQGPREDMALLNFRLKDPQIGRYVCRDPDGETQTPIDLLSGRRYSVGDQRGLYTVDLRDGGRSDIEFTSGPLEGSDASFFEGIDTGFRTLSFREVKGYFPSFSSTSSLSMTCTNVGEALSYPMYGDEAVPAPPVGSGGLSGLYAESVSSWTGYGYGKSYYDFYYFTPEGYVFRSEPRRSLSDIQCQRSMPNGAPRCSTYTVDGETIEIRTADFGTGGDNLSSVEISSLKSVSSGTTTLEGKFWANAGETIGICGPFSYCSSWYEEKNIIFTHSGQFLAEGRSQNLSSLSTGIGSSDAMNFGNSANAGTYSIDGNNITLRYNSGKVEQNFIAIFSPTDFHMDGWSYGPKED